MYPVWRLVLEVGLVSSLAFFLYVILFQPARLAKSASGSPQHYYEGAWWNHKVALWISFILSILVAIEVVFLSGSDFAMRIACDHPLMLVPFLLIHAPLSSFIILVLLLAVMRGSSKGVWLAKHFTPALVAVSVFLLTVQGFGVFLSLRCFA